MVKKLYIFILLSVLSLTGIGYAIACGCCNKSDNNVSILQPAGEQITEEKVQCPVMKTWILPSEAADVVEYNGKTYYFCCSGCKENFLAEPEKYVLELTNDS